MAYLQWFLSGLGSTFRHYPKKGLDLASMITGILPVSGL
jgi:hypothetical protein